MRYARLRQAAETGATVPDDVVVVLPLADARAAYTALLRFAETEQCTSDPCLFCQGAAALQDAILAAAPHLTSAALPPLRGPIS
jgi:hypothetical protein